MIAGLGKTVVYCLGQTQGVGLLALADAGDLRVQPLAQGFKGAAELAVHALAGLAHLDSYTSADLFVRLLQPLIQVLRDPDDLAAHGLYSLGRAPLGRRQLVRQPCNRPLDPVQSVLGRGDVETTHHLFAVLLDLAGQAFGQLLESGRVAGAVRLNPTLGGAQTLVQLGEGLLQGAQSVGSPRLSRVQSGADLRPDLLQDVVGRCGSGARRRGLDLIDALPHLTQRQPLTLFDVIEAAGD